MKTTIKGKGFSLALGLLVLCASWTASAEPIYHDDIYVKFEIGAYEHANYSASWMHGSTGCESQGLYGLLYMCGGPLAALTGELYGWYDQEDGVLSYVTGFLTAGDYVATIVDGRLTSFSDFSDYSVLYFENEDPVYFEAFSMGEGLPNFFDGNELILWGQNHWAYYCTPEEAELGECGGERYGFDLYGRNVPVSEPVTLGLFGIGLIVLGLSRRRRSV